MTENLEAVKRRYENAVEELTEKFKRTGDVVAVILNGSLSYDTVWEKSDIDMTIVVNDQKLEGCGFCIDCDSINVNIDIIKRSEFKRVFERESGGSVSHSFEAKGKLIYTTDEMLREFFEAEKTVGRDDMILSSFYMCGELICLLEKTHKWLEVKHDTQYAQLYVLKMAEAAARLEVCRNLEPPTREVVIRALELNPALFEKLYTKPLIGAMTYDELEECCLLVDGYLTGMLDIISKPVTDYMCDHRIHTLNTISKYFGADSHYLVHILDYLAEKGSITRVTQTIKLIARSKKEYEEVAYLCL